jgi:hypothetical protein
VSLRVLKILAIVRVHRARTSQNHLQVQKAIRIQAHLINLVNHLQVQKVTQSLLLQKTSQ